MECGHDATPPGRPFARLEKHPGAKLPGVLDLFVDLKPVLITAGHTVNVADGSWHLPKKELVSALQVVLGSGRLLIADALPEVAAWRSAVRSRSVLITGITYMYGFNP